MPASGLWQSALGIGVTANRPTVFPVEGNLAFYFSTDDNALFVASKLLNGNANWTQIAFAGGGAAWGGITGTLSAQADLAAALAALVPLTRTVNGKPLSADVTLAASDVGAVPTTRTVNGHTLSANVTVSADDVLPTQTSNSGKPLTTDGTTSSWGAITGSGNFVKSTSPSLVTPILGVAAATSLNLGGTGAVSRLTPRTAWASPPALTFATPPTGLTYTSQVGWYQHIGDATLVGYKINVNAIGSGGSGACTITMPFASASDNFNAYWANLFNGFTTSMIAVNSNMPTGVAAMQLDKVTVAAVGDVTSLTYADFAAGCSLSGMGMYWTN